MARDLPLAGGAAVGIDPGAMAARIWNPTVRYVGGRLVQALIVLLAVTLVVFMLARISGNPALLMAPPNSTPADIARISTSLGVDRPLPVQFAAYVGQVSHLDLGTSFSFRAPVRDLISNALPKTVALALAAFLFAGIFGTSLGLLSAMRAGSWIDVLSRLIALAGQSVPSFWLGMVLVLVFAVKVHLFPVYGAGGLDHLVLPAIALGAYPLAAVTRMTRSATLEALNADHIMFMRSKGVSRPVFLMHVLRSASLPVVTLSGIQLGHLLAGTVIIETLFAWPGMGLLAIQAIISRDYNVVQGVVLVDTALFVLLNLFVDLSYAWLDPRVRHQ